MAFQKHQNWTVWVHRWHDDDFGVHHRSSVLGPPHSGGSDPADKPGGQPNGQQHGHPTAAGHGLELSPAMAAVALVSSVGQNDVLGGSPTTGVSRAETH